MSTRPTAVPDALSALEVIGDRLWLPHQAGLEFYRRVDAERAALDAAYERGLRALEVAVAQVRAAFGEGRRYEDSRQAAAEAITNPLNTAVTALRAAQASDVSRVARESDTVLERVELLLDGRVGEALPSAVIRARVEEFINFRAPNEIPPGYRDASKQTPLRAAGDYLLWCELLDLAASSDRPVILVTDERKADWLDERRGGPRQELVAEFAQHSPHGYLQMSHRRFTELVHHHLGTEVSEASLNELTEVTEEQEDLVASIDLHPGLMESMPAASSFQTSPALMEAMRAASSFQTSPALMEAMRAASSFQIPPALMEAMRAAPRLQLPEEFGVSEAPPTPKTTEPDDEAGEEVHGVTGDSAE